ncbi:MAG: transposase [Hyphomicrobiales bacterium]|nr:transposase [Hyphomicrobiales bacterium]MCP5371162.1 transposase [Hyphomicrobiales bacterium]
MARPLRIEFPGAVYFVTAHGTSGPVFQSNADRQSFIDVLGQAVDRYGWICHGYNLGDDHYQLLVETPRANLSRGMRQINGVFTQRHNRRHGGTGPVFQGRFKSIVVEKDRHLLNLSRYVAMARVRSGRARKPEAWPWCHYGAMSGAAEGPDFLHTQWTLDQFAKTPGRAKQGFRNFCARDDGDLALWGELTRGVVLGSPAFARQVARHAGLSGKRKPPRRPALSRLRKEIPDRSEWAASAYRDHGYTLAEIAAAIDLHYSSISKIIKSWEDQQAAG